MARNANGKRTSRSSRPLKQVKRVKTVPVSGFYGKSKVAAAKAAGAALGFIAGDVGGAAAGWTAAGMAANRVLSKKVTYKRKYKKPYSNLSEHNDMSVHYLGKAQMGKSRYYKTLATYVYRNSNQAVINKVGSEVVQGKQGYKFLEVTMSLGWLRGDTNPLRGQNLNLADSLYHLNPFWNQEVAASLPIYPAANTAQVDSLYVKTVKSTVSLLSMVTVPQVVDLYFLTPKSDTSTAPNNYWEEIMLQKSNGQTAAGTINSLSNLLGPTPGGLSADNWGENPFTNVEFRKVWKAVKKTRVIMQPGDQHIVSAVFDYHRKFNRFDYASEGGRNKLFLANISIVPFAIVKAGVVGVATTEANATSEEVAYAAPKLGLIHEQVITLGALAPARVSHSRIFNGTLINDTTDKLRVIDVEDTPEEVKKN